MSVELAFHNRQRQRKIHVPLLRRLTLALLHELAADRDPTAMHADVGIHLVNAAEMARLNERFLGHSGSTDVITLDYGPQPHAPAAAQRCFGEIFICIDDAIAQGRRFGVIWQREVVRYVIHGLLHLQGYDDRRPGARRAMKREENRLLRDLARRFPLAQLGGSPATKRKSAVRP